ASGAVSPVARNGASEAEIRTQSEPPTTLSYTALAQYERCGYRFYAERVLGIPSVEQGARGSGGELTGAERGTAVHALLERLDFRRPSPPSDEAISGVAGRALSERQAA